MKRFIFTLLIIILSTLLIPIITVTLSGKTKPTENSSDTPEPASTVNVYIKNEDRVVTMDTSQYLKEVVSAEMPADFFPEALKAQAVAARTYLLNRKNAGPTDMHKGADICTDSTHCKAWISEEKRKESWDSAAPQNWEKISNAVDSTDGIVITYEGKLISAVFHSTSSGHTENAQDVWGGNVPYLVSVASTGDRESPKFNSEKICSVQEFKSICQKNLEGLDWSKGLFSDLSRSEAGGIISLNLGGVTVKGTKFRTMFSLRSTNIDIKEENGNIIMAVRGYGHGVGMSQYGANYLAAQGKDYTEILKTYYTGVEIQHFSEISR